MQKSIIYVRLEFDADGVMKSSKPFKEQFTVDFQSIVPDSLLRDTSFNGDDEDPANNHRFLPTKIVEIGQDPNHGIAIVKTHLMEELQSNRSIEYECKECTSSSHVWIVAQSAIIATLMLFGTVRWFIDSLFQSAVEKALEQEAKILKSTVVSDGDGSREQKVTMPPDDDVDDGHVYANHKAVDTRMTMACE